MTKEEFIIYQYARHLSAFYAKNQADDIIAQGEHSRQAALDIATEDANFIERNNPELFEQVQFPVETLAGNRIEAQENKDIDDGYGDFCSSIEQILYEPIEFFAEQFNMEDIEIEFEITFSAIRICKCPSLYLSPHGKMLAQGLIRTCAKLYVHYFFCYNSSDHADKIEFMRSYLANLAKHICSMYYFISKEEQDEFDFIERTEKEVKRLKRLIDVSKEDSDSMVYVKELLGQLIINCAIYYYTCPVPVDYKDYDHAVKCFRSMFSNK